MQTVAVAALVTDITRQARWSGLVAALSYLTAGVVTPLGGALADRHDRRRMLMLAVSAQAILAVILASLYVSGHASPLVLVINTACEGMLVALTMPARGAMLPDLVERDQILDASALGMASWNLGRIVGPALGGVFIAFGSYTWVFVFNAVSFLGVALAMIFVRIPKLTRHAHSGNTWQRVKEGFQEAKSEPGCRAAMEAIGVLALFVSPFIALVPAVAQLVFHGNAVDTAHMVAAQGIGAVAGLFLLPVIARRVGRGKSLIGLLFAQVPLVIAYSSVPSLGMATVVLGVLGGAYMAVLASLSAVVQLRAPAHARARVIAFYWTMLNLTYPIGATVQGSLADAYGVRAVEITAAVAFLCILIVAVVARPATRALLDTTPGEVSTAPSTPAGPVASTGTVP